MAFLVAPAADIVTQGYGCCENQQEWYEPTCPSRRFHAGIDLGSSQGGWAIFNTPVCAARAGVVTAVGVVYLGDQAVAVLGDDGVTLEYGHLNLALVYVGQRVAQGQQIGALGTKGNSSAPHLHLEARRDGPRQGDNLAQTLDPTPYLWEDDDMPDEATFKQWVRDVLNEGTSPGQQSWATTVESTLQQAQANANGINQLLAKLSTIFR